MKRITILTLLLGLLFTLNACSKTKAYQLVFETNGGSSVEAIQYNEGETITLPANPTKDGLSFTGWYLNEKLTVPFELPEKMPAKSIKVYAKYQAKLTFNSNGGSELEDIYVSPGAIISKPANPVYEGHVFLGWYTDEACTQKLPMFMPATSVTAYAKWMSKDDPNATISLLDDWTTSEQNAFTLSHNDSGALVITCLPGKGSWSLIKYDISSMELAHCTVLEMIITGEKGAEVIVKFNNDSAAETKVVLTGEENQVVTYQIPQTIKTDINLFIFPYGGATISEEKTVIIKQFNLY